MCLVAFHVKVPARWEKEREPAKPRASWAGRRCAAAAADTISYYSQLGDDVSRLVALEVNLRPVVFPRGDVGVVRIVQWDLLLFAIKHVVRWAQRAVIVAWKAVAGE